MTDCWNCFLVRIKFWLSNSTNLILTSNDSNVFCTEMCFMIKIFIINLQMLSFDLELTFDWPFLPNVWRKNIVLTKLFNNWPKAMIKNIFCQYLCLVFLQFHSYWGSRVCIKTFLCCWHFICLEVSKSILVKITQIILFIF